MQKSLTSLKYFNGVFLTSFNVVSTCADIIYFPSFSSLLTNLIPSSFNKISLAASGHATSRDIS